MTRRKRAEEAEGAQGAEGEKITNYQLPIPHTPHPIPYNLFITPHTLSSLITDARLHFPESIFSLSFLG
ncbi:hypothetical protein [Chroococcidiopsis sp. CCNUC1]|uniref:hypothetical protein n=1 Tax=Chroococcidiopsis sp. CCNUC1 TaxID=2653189 RepID=UPI002021F135|nr:hypothetical protein [Chroococcidiopsis sp. CCNUC1]URD50724.1 hypothetical protein M5J74_01760 [Chroococcidiopsis sp. CCNUC1]